MKDLLQTTQSTHEILQIQWNQFQQLQHGQLHRNQLMQLQQWRILYVRIQLLQWYHFRLQHDLQQKYRLLQLAQQLLRFVRCEQCYQKIQRNRKMVLGLLHNRHCRHW